MAIAVSLNRWIVIRSPGTGRITGHVVADDPDHVIGVEARLERRIRKLSRTYQPLCGCLEVAVERGVCRDWDIDGADPVFITESPARFVSPLA